MFLLGEQREEQGEKERGQGPSGNDGRNGHPVDMVVSVVADRAAERGEEDGDDGGAGREGGRKAHPEAKRRDQDDAAAQAEEATDNAGGQARGQV